MAGKRPRDGGTRWAGDGHSGADAEPGLCPVPKLLAPELAGGEGWRVTGNCRCPCPACRSPGCGLSAGGIGAVTPGLL